MKIEIGKLRTYLNARISLLAATIENPSTTGNRRNQCRRGVRDCQWLIEMIDEWEEDALDGNAPPEFPDIVTE